MDTPIPLICSIIKTFHRPTLFLQLYPSVKLFLIEDLVLITSSPNIMSLFQIFELSYYQDLFHPESWTPLSYVFFISILVLDIHR